jgi:tetratricopeptide (TPR) repeat protein
MKTGIRQIILLNAAIACLLLPAHITASGEQSTADPFHDVFYTYYTESRSEARRMLSVLSKNHALRGRSLINTGKIDEMEKRHAAALSSYRRALSSGERLAVPYLYAALVMNDPPSAEALLGSLSAAKTDRWLSYEQTLARLRAGDRAGAIRRFSESVALGFNSRELVRKEPLFDPIRGTPEFAKLVAGMNAVPVRKLAPMIEEIRRDGTRGTPLAMGPGLSAAGTLERKGRLAEAERALRGLLETRLAFNERSVVLYRLARLRARQGDAAGARDFLRRHAEHFGSSRDDPTGYRGIVLPMMGDIIANDDAGLLPYAEPGKY